MILLDALDPEMRKQALNERDGFGWTPLHHAAVTSQVLFETFLEFGGDPTIKTKLEADCDELRTLSGRVVNLRSQDTLFINEDTKNRLIKISQLTENERQHIFGSDFFHTDSLIYPPHLFKELWQANWNEDRDYPNIPNIHERYETFRLSPLSLIIAKCPSLQDVSDHFLELRAGQNISEGTIISEYTGLRSKEHYIQEGFSSLFNMENIENSEYLALEVNARRVGNEARFANFGFPNAVLTSSVERGAERLLLVALRHISEGEAIHWSYGPDIPSLTLGTQILLGKEEMVACYQKYGKSIFKELECIAKKAIEKRGLSSLEEKMEILRYQVALEFLLDCPTALLYLHFSGTIGFELWDENFLSGNNNLPFEFWIKKHTDSALNMACIFETLKKSKSENKAIEENIRYFVLDRLEKIPLLHILKGIELLADGSLGSVEEVDCFLKSYDWMRDPSHPISFERRTDVYYNILKKHPKKIIETQLKAQLSNPLISKEGFRLIEAVLKKLSEQ